MTSAAAPAPVPSMWPRLTSVLGIVVAVVLAGLAALLFSVVSFDRTFLAPAIGTALLAVLCALTAVLAFRVVRAGTQSRRLAVPLRVIAVIAAVAGVAELVIGLLVGLAGGIAAIGIGFIVLVLSLAVVLLAAMVAGAAARSGRPDDARARG